MSGKTVDLTPFSCILLVSLDDLQAAACTRALMPLPPIRATVATAYDEVLQRHPLVVVARHDASPTDLAMLREVVSACAAELVTVGTESPGELSRLLMDAVRAAERRRIAK